MFEILEIDLLKRSGLTRDVLRNLRAQHLVEGQDFGKNGRWLAYTREAADRLLTLGGLVEPVVAPPNSTRAKKPLLALPPVPGTVLKLLAWRPVSNQRILEAYLPGSNPNERASIVRVKVASNANFVRDMEIWGRLEQGDLYELWDPDRNRPQPPPRARGRW